MNDELREQFIALYRAALALYGDPEDCDDCADLNDRPCRIHSPETNTLYYEMLASEEILGLCHCGHKRSQHHDEDTTRCRECGCDGFLLDATLPMVPATDGAGKEDQ